MVSSTFILSTVLFANLALKTHAIFSESADFCYNRPECGPSTWEGICRDGARQSPIALTVDANTPIIYPQFPILFSSAYFTPRSHFYIQDNGHTLQIHFENSENYHPESPYFLDGETETYVLSQMHLHWGEEGNGKGSEHTLNGGSAPMELHMVHYSKRFQNLNDALENGGTDAVTVLGVFVEFGPITNPGLEAIVTGIQELLKNTTIGEDFDVHVPFTLADLVPKDEKLEVFRYDGSLTTPPCTQKVKWVVFREPIWISNRLFREFVDLPDSHGDKLINNFRPIQPYFGRTVELHHLRWNKSDKELCD